MPIVRLEVEHMKHAIVVAISDAMAQMDVDIKRAVERACTPENIARVIEDATHKALGDAIRQDVEAFFRFGAGRAVVRERVNAELSKQYLP